MCFEMIAFLTFVLNVFCIHGNVYSADFWNNAEVCSTINEDTIEFDCSALTDKQSCVRARESRDTVSYGGQVLDVKNQPCAWCEDGPCLINDWICRCQPVNLVSGSDLALSQDFTSCSVDAVCKIPYQTSTGNNFPLLDCSFGAQLTGGSEICIDGVTHEVSHVTEADCAAQYGRACTLDSVHLRGSANDASEGVEVSNGPCVSNVEMDCLQDVASCKIGVQEFFDELNRDEVPAVPGPDADDCHPLPEAIRDAMCDEGLELRHVNRLCIYDEVEALDQYYYVIRDDLVLNTCVVHGEIPSSECRRSAGRVCSAISRGRTVVGTLEQQARMLRRALESDDKYHPQCLTSNS